LGVSSTAKDGLATKAREAAITSECIKRACMGVSY